MNGKNKSTPTSNLFNCILNLENETRVTILQEKKYRKGDSIVKKQHIASNLYFIESGLVKMSRNVDAKEFIMQFFVENEMVTVLNSFNSQTPSNYRIIALEDTVVKYLSHKTLNQLFMDYSEIGTQYRDLQALAINRMMERINTMLLQNPYDRYHSFMEKHRELIQRISLGDVSSYLGISQISVSRIRARK